MREPTNAGVQGNSSVSETSPIIFLFLSTFASLAAVAFPVNGGERELRTAAIDILLGILSVQAVTKGGLVSVPARIILTNNRKPKVELRKRRLVALSIGVSKYVDANLTLGFAAKDATDFGAALKHGLGNHFGDVDISVIRDSQVTRDEVLRRVESLVHEELQDDDYVMIFLAGHGLRDTKNQYRYCVCDVNFAKLEATTVAWHELFEPLSRLKCKTLLFVDTCHAGAVLGGREILSDSRDSYNAVLRQAADNSSGVITLAACLPHEQSVESQDLGNGVFTKALVEALQGRADSNENGVLTITEVETYVSTRVESLTGRAQSTTAFKSTSVPSNLTVGLVSQ